MTTMIPMMWPMLLAASSFQLSERSAK